LIPLNTLYGEVLRRGGGATQGGKVPQQEEAPSGERHRGATRGGVAPLGGVPARSGATSMKEEGWRHTFGRREARGGGEGEH